MLDRNTNAHFSQVPSIDIPRSRFDRSHSVKFTFNAGLLIPFLVDPVYPGDTVEISTSKVVRLQTLLTPLMDDLFLDIYYFFVPNRLVWTHWREFCGENRTSPWIQQTEYRVPGITSAGGLGVGSIADYMGLPLGILWPSGSSKGPSALPFRGYGLIWNEFFRDQNLQDPLNINLGDSYQPINSILGSSDPLPVCKTHDFYTSALPQPQKGPAVELPLGSSAPLVWTDDLSKSYEAPLFGTGSTATSSLMYPMHMISNNTGSIKSGYLQVDDNNNVIFRSGTIGSGIGSNTPDLRPDNVVARTNLSDLNSRLMTDLSAATAITVNDLRLAFQTQKYYERLSAGGSRYREILLSFFGVSNGDARMQIPEYLGGNRIPLHIHQVENTAQSNGEYLGDVGAYSVTNDIHDDVFHSFTEHGYLFGLCCVRYNHTYAQGMEPHWYAKDKFSWYWPTFAHIGEQPILSKSLYCDGSDDDESVFGYQEAWADLRYKPNRVAGEMRPGIENSLASWNLSDYYTSRPTLSAGWIKEDKAPLDRALAVTSEVVHQILADFYIDAKWTRPMPVYSVPGLIDHF